MKGLYRPHTGLKWNIQIASLLVHPSQVAAELLIECSMWWYIELCYRSSNFLGPFRPRNAGNAHAQAQSVQLAEWWADFDERYMRPVFSRPEYSADWASPNGEQIM